METDAKSPVPDRPRGESLAEIRVRAPYKQKYKKSWESIPEFKDWLSSCELDEYAAYCNYCRKKLHAHKKSLLMHSNSSKHKRYELAAANGQECLANEHGISADQIDAEKAQRRVKSTVYLFDDAWLNESQFSSWLRRVPSDCSKALCASCMNVLVATRGELVRHTRSARHRKAVGASAIMSPTPGRPNEVSHNDTEINGEVKATDLPGLLVDEVLSKLDTIIPLKLAEKWDNVGVLTQPTQPNKVDHIMLTIDLTDRVVDEAVKKRAQFIISYHPPIFTPLKSLRPSGWQEKKIVSCIENKITVYSPHTCLDAIKGGINDWLISAFRQGDQDEVRPVQYSYETRNTARMEVLFSAPQQEVQDALKELPNTTIIPYGDSTEVRITCDERSLPKINEKISQSGLLQMSYDVSQLRASPLSGIGMGRIIKLTTAIPLYEAVHKIKAHLDLTNVRLAMSPKHFRETPIVNIAVCAGSGAKVLEGCGAELWVTGEMSHHELLAATHGGSTVVLCEHSNTERGFMRLWSRELKSLFEEQIHVSLAERDRDPIKIV